LRGVSRWLDRSQKNPLQSPPLQGQGGEFCSVFPPLGGGIEGGSVRAGPHIEEPPPTPPLQGGEFCSRRSTGTHAERGNACCAGKSCEQCLPGTVGTRKNVGQPGVKPDSEGSVLRIRERSGTRPAPINFVGVPRPGTDVARARVRITRSFPTGRVGTLDTLPRAAPV
jgi:hypothetical protein